MQQILIALLLGVIAGVVDAAQMLKMKGIPKPSIVATFAQWILLGLVIPYVNWPSIHPWLKGMVLGVLGLVPFMILAFNGNRASIIPTAVFGASLGAGIGFAGSYFIH